MRGGAIVRPCLSRWEWGAALGLALIPALVRMVSYPGYPGADDAYIHAALIENLHATGTLNVGPGGHVNMTTSPLFTFGMTLLRFLTTDIMALGMVLSCAAVMLAVFMTYVLAREHGGHIVAALGAAALAATNVHLWRWGGTFMEVSFAYLWVVLAWWRYKRLQAGGASRGLATAGFGCFLGVGFLIRPELGLLLPTFILHDWMSRRRMAWKRHALTVAGWLVPAGGYLVAAWLFFGSGLATTYSAKTTGGWMWGNPVVTRQLTQVAVSALPGLGVILVAGMGVFLLERRVGKRVAPTWRAVTVAWLLPLLAFAFYYLKTESLQSAARYLLPFLALMPLLVVPAWTCLRGKTLGIGLLAGAVTLQAGVAVHLNAKRVAPVLQRMQTDYVATMSEAADRIVSLAAPDEVTLVVVDIGVVSWRLQGRRRLADAGGLMSPELAGESREAQIERSGAVWVLESLGTGAPWPAIGEFTLELMWERAFRSHSVGQPRRIFVARLYRVR